MRVGPKGAGHLPADIGARLGFLPGTEVEFVIDDDGNVRLVRAKQAGRNRGERMVRRLRGRAVSQLTTDEILALTREP
jgi:bifunctional DNA-binding transcriptional regulator/antitoxin component of YhaV-PrlF toxin-antitoxin module